ncbi:DUF2924 domain-containing protein [Roseovarius arcticus]|uniref:DUF2924 domain-containing protein n=1 Tax=Roseovarius arcticus TaxID=2547404 RepID=UPI0011100083|nr:DUF2924 domain-containing protein [Roseovarius arcticus]
MKVSVSDIETMNRPALISAWTDLFRCSVPKGLSQSFLRRFLAFEAQTRQFGGLPKGFMADLERSASAPVGKSRPNLKPGGRLLREWNGVTHVVEVTEAGYLWNGQCHRSLSSVARAITGAHWSGPRFFRKGGSS